MPPVDDSGDDVGGRLGACGESSTSIVAHHRQPMPLIERLLHRSARIAGWLAAQHVRNAAHRAATTPVCSPFTLWSGRALLPCLVAVEQLHQRALRSTVAVVRQDGASGDNLIDGSAHIHIDLDQIFGGYNNIDP